MCETHRRLGSSEGEITIPRQRRNKRVPKLSEETTSSLALPATTAMTQKPVNVINSSTAALVKNAISRRTVQDLQRENPTETAVTQQTQPEKVEGNPVVTLLLAACNEEQNYAGKQNRLARREWQASTAIAIAQACGYNMGTFLVNNQQERVAAFRRVAKMVKKSHPEYANNLPQFLSNPV